MQGDVDDIPLSAWRDFCFISRRVFVVVVVNANCCVLPVIRAINIVEFGMMGGVVGRGVLEKFYKFENLSNLTDGSVYTMINRSDCHDLMKFLWNEF